MAGMVFVSETSDWGASSSVFYWVVEALADAVSSPELAARLREVSEENLGSFGLTDFPPDQQAELRAAIAELPGVAARTLPPSDAREAVIAQVHELANLVARNP